MPVTPLLLLSLSRPGDNACRAAMYGCRAGQEPSDHVIVHTRSIVARLRDAELFNATAAFGATPQAMTTISARLPYLIFTVLLCGLLAAGCGRGAWRKGGEPGSKPYTVHGKTYYPLKSARGFVEEGIASWYGPGFHGKKTASGELYNQNALTAAHKILPLGTRARITRLSDKKSIVVTINDRGPFVADRVIDLSRKAAATLGIMSKGTARVRVQSLDAIPRLKDDGVMEGDFYIQLGSFADRGNADSLIKALSRAGHQGRLFQSGNRRWNVQIGPWADSARAREMLGSFRSRYPQAFVVGGS
jgi:rare lipoprotein A